MSQIAASVGLLLAVTFPPALESSVPKEVSACMRDYGRSLTVTGKLNPFYLRGDFDGDGQVDHAIAVSAHKAAGVLVCSSRGRRFLLGAGSSFNDMTDLNFDGWTVHPRATPVERGVGESTIPRLKGDAMLLVWTETASGLVLWDGTRFVWYQQGD